MARSRWSSAPITPGSTTPTTAAGATTWPHSRSTGSRASPSPRPTTRRSSTTCGGSSTRQLEPLHHRHACRAYLEAKEELGLPADRVPQLDEVTRLLEPVDRLPLPAGRGPRPAAGVLRLVRRLRLLLDPVPAPPVPAAVHARARRRPRGRRPRQPAGLPRARRRLPPGRRGRRPDRTDEAPPVPVARVLVLDGVRRGLGGRRAEGLRRRHPLVVRGDGGVPHGRRPPARRRRHG